MSLTQEQVMLEEYSRTREEIDQLNGQAFATLTGSLAINFALLGAFFTSSRPREELATLPFLAFIALAVGSMLLAHKIRMAHRLSFFLKYFVQPNLPGLHWPDAYFEFRRSFAEKHGGILASFPERFVDVQNFVLLVAQLAEIGLIFDIGSSVLAGCSGVILVVQIVLLRRINDYTTIEELFQSMTAKSDRTESSSPPNAGSADAPPASVT